MAAKTALKPWSCAGCNHKQLSIVAHDNKIILSCDNCGDGQWVKRD